MELNYIILAHKEPKQLRRLVTRLQGEECQFYVHIDARVELGPFEDELSDLKSVQLVRRELRERTPWADIGIVLATMRVMKQICGEGRGGYCILLSGQDYPIRNKLDIKDFFEQNNGRLFISLWSLPVSFLDGGGLPRISSYKVSLNSDRSFVTLPTVFQRRFYSIKAVKAVTRIVMARKFRHLLKTFKRRQHPAYIRPYGGDQWWALPIEVVRAIVDFNDRHPDYLAFHRDTFAPDEIVFQSIIAHLYSSRREQTASSLTYVNWKRKNAFGPGPAVFTAGDFEELVSQADSKLFARKFDTKIDAVILDRLDQWIGYDGDN
jgi:hypothetical protein